MIDIIIVTHGEYGKAMLASSELIMGEQENVQASELSFRCHSFSPK